MKGKPKHRSTILGITTLLIVGFLVSDGAVSPEMLWGVLGALGGAGSGYEGRKEVERRKSN